MPALNKLFSCRIVPAVNLPDLVAGRGRAVALSHRGRISGRGEIAQIDRPDGL
jgi:hypothetical protein